MDISFIYGAALFLCYTFSIQGEKRILLNDPDVVAERLNRIEQKVTVLETENLQQKQAITKLEAELLQQKQRVTTLETNSLQQKQTVANLKAENLQLEQRLQQVFTEDHQNSQLIQNLQSSVSKLQSGGSTYIRWGRTVCPNNSTELVYAGYTGGGMDGQTGSAAELVCLPTDPNFGKTSGGDYARVYGAEFETNFWASNSQDEDVPCAVCRNPHTVSSIMIPGKNVCYSGWNLEYYGYLSSGYWNAAAASSYNCVDINPEYVPSGVSNQNGKLFYNVLAKCGSLPCPPYVNNYPLTCVVCSK